MAAAAALSVGLHLAVLALRLPNGSGVAARLSVPVPLAVRLIAPTQPDGRSTDTPAAKDESVPRAVVTGRPSPAESRSLESQRPRKGPAAVAVTPFAETAPTPALTAPPVAPAVPAQEATPTVPVESVRPLAPTVDTATPAYMASAGLNPPPRPLDDITPEFPEAAGTRGGTVVLRLFINETGGVDKAEVVRASPPGVFEASALAAFASARFSPGFFGGMPVRSQIMYEVEFAPQIRDTPASVRGY